MEILQNRKQQSKQDFWQEHLRAWKVSRLSQREYCRQHSLSLSTFGYWRRKIKHATSDKPRFYPLAIPPTTLTEIDKNTTIALYLDGGRFHIEVDEGFSPTLLKSVITTLEQL